jgi:hypothetical protein
MRGLGRDGGTEGQRDGGTEGRRDGGTEGGTEGRRDGGTEGGTEGQRDGGILADGRNVVFLLYGQVLYDQLLLNPPRSGRKQG